MSIDAWITVAVLLLCFGLLVTSKYATDVVMMGGLTLLLAAGVLTPVEALQGFANEGVATIAVLYVVVSGLQETGVVQWLSTIMLGHPKTIRAAQLRLMLPVAGLSAFFNNSPVVAMMVPAVSRWARHHNFNVSQLMMPLSFAAIIGGTCTLIGTSTNLILYGLLKELDPSIEFSLFTLASVGIPCTIVVLVYMVTVGNRLLPQQSMAMSDFEDLRKYTVELAVDPDGPLVGKTIEQAGLRNLPGLYIIAIERDGEELSPVSHQQILRTNDRLSLAGVVETVVDLKKIHGLRLIDDADRHDITSSHTHLPLYEAVVSEESPLTGKSIKDGNFRAYYNAAVVAVARDGKTINRKLGDIVLQSGDTLLLSASNDFIEQQRYAKDFLLVSAIDDSHSPRHSNRFIASGIFCIFILLVATGLASIFKAGLFAAAAMIVTRCTTGAIARNSIDWGLLITVAASVALGHAVESTGIAELVATQTITLGGQSVTTTLAVIFAVTALLTSVISNVATAVLMFPIATATANSLGADLVPFVITLMVAASASFATPVGYQTNLMVYGPGGYRFGDFVRAGLPLTVLVGLVVTVTISCGEACTFADDTTKF